LTFDAQRGLADCSKTTLFNLNPNSNILPASNALVWGAHAPRVLVSAPHRNELVLSGRGDEVVDLAKVNLFREARRAISSCDSAIAVN
jgi:hypothetical protein